jgi:hypothetical protein
MAKLTVVYGPMDERVKARILREERELAALGAKLRELEREVDARDSKLRAHYRKYPDHWKEVQALWQSGEIPKPGILE